MIVGDQSEVLAFLGEPSHYPAKSTVERIDTHASSVFLAGDRAYKVKRAVRYDYLDYSTLERRRAACDAELRLNRRTAPRLYLGMVPITRRAQGGLELDGAGPPVEWLVVMQRFAQETLLDRIAEAGALARQTIIELADAIADFHGAAEPRRDCGGAGAIERVITGNTAALVAAGGAVDQVTVTEVDRAGRHLLAVAGETLDSRRDRGMVRQCHGDLHLRNIVLLDGRPTLFDAVEFNDEFSCIDVMYDFAFLVMDLLGRDLAVHANALLNRYLARTADFEGLQLLPLFLACRAAIRAKTSLAAAALDPDAGRVADLRRRAARYLQLAAHVARRVPPRLVAIGGLSGSGKSTLAARLAPAIGAPPGAIVLRSDVVRKRLFGEGTEAPLPPWAYAAARRQAVYVEMHREARRALEAGYSVVLDAVFADPVDRRAAEALAARAGVSFAGLWLDTTAGVLEQRVTRREVDASDATVDVLHRQLREPVRRLHWPRIDANGTVEATERDARRLLGAVEVAAGAVPEAS